MKFFKIILITILFTFSNIYSQIFWEKTAGPDTTSVWSLVINSSGNIFAGTHLDGVFRSSDNGSNWTNLGVMNYDIWSMITSTNGDILVNTDPWGGVFRSSDNGNNWIDTLDFKHFNLSIAINNSNGYIFVGTAALGIWRSTDDGTTWDSINNGMTASQINTLIVNSSGDIFAGTYGKGIFRTLDQGASWVQINQGLTGTRALFVSSFAMNSDGDIFAGTSGSGVFRSTDDGDNWTQINNGLTSQGLYVYSLTTNFYGDIFAGTDDGIFRSTKNGDNWVQINNGLTNKYTHSLAVNSNGFVFAGTEGGIFRSTSAFPVELISFSAFADKNKIKLNWQTATEVNNYGFEIERSENIPDNLGWEKIGFVPGNGNSNSPKDYSYVDLNPVGGSDFLYRLKQIDNDGQFEYSDIVEAELVPTEFALYQNYPNPFNPNTSIRYSLKDNTQFVSLIVYDILGNEIQKLVNEEKPAGNYELTWSAVNIPSGIYFYRLQAGSFTETRKMSLLK